MNQLFSSFYTRLSVLFLVLLLIMGTIYIFLSVQSSISFVKEADQHMNFDLAKSISKEIEPFIQDSIQTSEIKHLMHYLMVINPYIEIYLLDSTGNIMAFFAEPAAKVKREQVSLGPIKQFISATSATSVMGDDPRNLNQQKPFSAAPVTLKDNTPGYIYVILGGEQYDNASEEIREQFLVSTVVKGLLVAILFTALLGLLLFFLMTKRLRKVTNVVTGFKEGNLEQRLDEASSDDFGQLSRAFNQMADTIVGNIDKLKRTDDLRRELVANVSHDLRTPLTAIQGYLETILMKQDTLSPEERAKYLEISLQNSKYLNRLVAQLFELSKLEAHQIQPVKETFSLPELIQDVVLKFKPTADQKTIEINYGQHNNVPPVSGDIGMIERVLSNLIDNAIRYLPNEGSIYIASIPKHQKVEVQISDTGPGIASDDIPHIFSRYYRGTRSASGEKQGTGLGLAISKRIIELHDSDIRVESEPNKGTTFSFELAAV